ncbi:MAG: TRAP transporter TatT component family protein [Nitrospira sp.]|nr:TRAP transporter TatT component family protein [Nitrospira sp.]
MQTRCGDKPGDVVRQCLFGGLLATILLGGCSLHRIVVDAAVEALAGDADVYASEEDPDLVREAIPFGLKTLEGLLAATPAHRGLLLSAAKGFATYAYLLQDEADRLEASDTDRARLLRARVKRLYLRSRDYALQGLELVHPRFEALLRRDSASALAGTTKEDVPFLYWAGAAWGGALSAAPDDLSLVSETPLCGALMLKVIDLHEQYESGGAHEFLISYEANRPGGSVVSAREHFRRALAVADVPRASLFLALAENLSVKQQNLNEFKELLAAVLAVDPGRKRSERLITVMAQRRARWLLGRIPELFLDADPNEVVP